MGTPGALQINKLADKSGNRNEDGSWPLAGVRIVGDPPIEISVPQSYVTRARAEGWMTLENEQVVYRQAAPNDDPLAASPHQFMQADAIVIHTVDGDVRYRVTRQPDKYADNAVIDERGRVVKASDYDDETRVTDEIYDAGETRVDAFYNLTLEVI